MSLAGQSLRPGDQVRFDDEIWTVTAVGSSVRLTGEAGRARS
ncbi:PTS glucitol/sorbitol transporter subunit IIA [Lentzea flava]|nr:PTS glucitol/sorbitol transporter subunit IIA [Lentzea flava]